jgi:hypothetical protein
MSIERALTMLVKLSTARILSSTAGCVWPLTPKISGHNERWLLRASGYNERWLNHADVADEAEKGGLLRVAFGAVRQGWDVFGNCRSLKPVRTPRLYAEITTNKELGLPRRARAPLGAIRLVSALSALVRATNVHCGQ